MKETGIISAQEQKNRELLEAGLFTADCYITRNYLINLSDRSCLAPTDDLCRDIFLRLYRVEKFVYDKAENVNDKLVSVYSSLHELGGTAILVIQGSATGINFYLGARSERKAALCGQVLEKSLKGNFPGSSTKLYSTSGASALLDDLLGPSLFYQQNISSVSVVPATRDEDKDKFVQGIEKFIDTMQGETYTAIFLSVPISKTDLEYRKRGLEELASALSPFAKTTLTYGENTSCAVSNGMFTNFSRSINQSIANTNGYNRGSNTSDTRGSSHGFGLGGFNTGKNRSRTSGYSAGTSWSRAVTEGTADTTGEGTNTSDTETIGDSRTLTIEYGNKSVENLLKTIDQQMERIRACESFGLWDCAAYFVAPEVQVSVTAANTYKALVSGDDTCVENSYINVWDSRNPASDTVLKSIRYGMHPQFEIPEGATSGFDSQVVTPGSFISGKELPLFMGIPQKSVSGLPVSSIAEFGRNVFTLNNEVPVGTLPLGRIYHMGREEEASVSLDINSFTSHCFIAGSTGSGKSNTTYVLLNEFHRNNIPFLVIEPAKGEYKNEFGALPGINIFSTNPRIGQMLRINPFWFDHEEIHVLEHLDRLVEIFNACWEMYAAMPAILKAAAERIYTEKGWNTLNSIYLGQGKPQFPTFNDLLRVLPEVIKTSGYSSDTQGDYTGALVTRVSSLANGIYGQIFCSSYAIPDEILFDKYTIIDLSRVGSTETKALIMGLLVMKLTEYRMAQATGSNSKLRHITVLEEAHNLLKRTSSAQGQETANLLGKSVEMISNSIAEMRTYGEGFIIVDQSPTAVDIAAIKNTNTKIIMRLPEKTDCEAAGNAMALNDEQVKELAKLPTGVGAVIQNNWLETVLVKISAASHNFKKECIPSRFEDTAVLRGKAVELILRQYYEDEKLDLPLLEASLRKVNAPKDKIDETISGVSALVDCVGPELDISALCFGLLHLTGSEGVFAVHEHILRTVDLKRASDSDYKILREWHDKIAARLAATLIIDNNLVNHLVRMLIYGKANAPDSCTDYYTVYRMLYDSEFYPDRVNSGPEKGEVLSPNVL